jgi:hypothetical protein
MNSTVPLEEPPFLARLKYHALVLSGVAGVWWMSVGDVRHTWVPFAVTVVSLTVLSEIDARAPEPTGRWWIFNSLRNVLSAMALGGIAAAFF